MISLPAPTKSPISQPLTAEQREHLIGLVAERYLDSMELRDLEQFFLETQAECLTDYSDGELLEAIEDITSEYEYEEIVNELG